MDLKRHGAAGSLHGRKIIPIETAMEEITKAQRAGKLTLKYAMTGRSLAFYRESENMLTQKGGLDGATKVSMILSGGIASLSDAYNIGKNLTTEQMMDISDAILADYPTMKLAEFMYFIQKAKKGEYGKAYDRMDMPTVFEWLHKFFAEKDELIENKRYEEKAGYEMTGDRVGGHSIKDVIQEPEYQKFKLEREIQRQRQQQAETTDP